MNSENRVSEFLEHYGVKGMKKPVPPTKLDRVYRIAAGTAALKQNIQKGKKEKEKTQAKETAKAIKSIQAQAKAAAENQPVPMEGLAKDQFTPDTDSKVDLDLGESTVISLLKKYGTIKVADLE